MNTIPVCKHGEKDRDWSNLMLPANLGIELDDMRLLVPKDLPAPLPPVVIGKETLDLKKLKIHADMSEETTCFSAEIWFQGKLVGHASNEGRGGGTFIRAVSQGALKEAEEWAIQLPPESSYNRVYETILAVESEFAGITVDLIKGAWWFTTNRMDLDSIVDQVVNAAASRKALRGIGSYAAFGPGKETGDRPGIMKFKRTLLPEWLVAARKSHKWAVPLTAFMDLPYHYYPSPHPFASSLGGEMQIRHKESRQVGVPYFQGTTDHQVVMQIGERDDNNQVTGKPEDFEFVPGAAATIKAHQKEAAETLVEKS